MTRSLVAAALLVVACSGPGKPMDRTTPPPAHDDDSTCPVAIPGTSVSVEDTDTGAALVFVTTGDVAELRKRVAAMAAAHNEEHAKMGPLPTGAGDGEGGHHHHDMGAMDHGGGGAMVGVHSAAAEQDIDGGARLVFTVNPDDVGAMHDELEMHAAHMAKGTCEMPAMAPAAPSAAETAAFEQAKPVFAKYCAGCHTQGGQAAAEQQAEALEHFDMTSYPFGGHHAATIGTEVKEVLGATGEKPSMPKNRPGSVKGDELALVLAWADAFEAAHPAHDEHDEHDAHDHH